MQAAIKTEFPLSLTQLARIISVTKSFFARGVLLRPGKDMAENDPGQNTGPSRSDMIQSVRPRMKRDASDVSDNRASLVTTEQHSEAFKAISEALSNSTK